MDVLYEFVNELTLLVLPTNFTLFERLLLFGVYFGVIVFIFRKLKGD